MDMLKPYQDKFKFYIKTQENLLFNTSFMTDNSGFKVEYDEQTIDKTALKK